MFSRNVKLLVLRVACHLNEFHTVQKRSWNPLHGVRRRNKKHLREVDRELHIVIPELMILFRIQHLKQRRGSVSLIVTAHLVDLVQKHQRILHTGAAQTVHKASRHGSDVSLPMSPDLRLIAHTAEADPHVFLIQRTRHRARNACLAGSRRSHQTDDRAFSLARQIAHREKLQHTLLDFLQTVVIFLQNPLCVCKVFVVLGRFIPRKLQQRLDITAGHRALR